MKRKQTRFIAFMSMFLAIQLVLLFTPLGYLRIGVISATTMHIPVIIAALAFGMKGGIFTGFIFGLTSVINATMAPGITSFVFSPFIEVGGVHGNFSSLLIAFIPRILMGVITVCIYNFMKKKNINDSASILSASVIATLTNTVLVLAGIYVFFGAEYAAATGVSYEVLISVLFSVILSNGIAEIIVGALASLSIGKALKKYIN